MENKQTKRLPAQLAVFQEKVTLYLLELSQTGHGIQNRNNWKSFSTEVSQTIDYRISIKGLDAVE